jgi:hypothetical protein
MSAIPVSRKSLPAGGSYKQGGDLQIAGSANGVVSTKSMKGRRASRMYWCTPETALTDLFRMVAPRSTHAAITDGETTWYWTR